MGITVQIRFYGAFYDEGSVSLALEYMDCGSISTMIKIMRQAFPKQIPLMPEFVVSRIIGKVSIYHLSFIKTPSQFPNFKALLLKYVSFIRHYMGSITYMISENNSTEMLNLTTYLLALNLERSS